MTGRDSLARTGRRTSVSIKLRSTATSPLRHNDRLAEFRARLARPALIRSGATTIDVRTTEEFADGHVPTAINMPVEEFSTHLAEIDKLVAADHSRPVVVYCASGMRAAKVKTELEAAGYSHVVNGGGYDSLR